ncbi:MAG: adenylate/guanylate cyclase domain-containing protein [Paracoccaceae bacterium]
MTRRLAAVLFADVVGFSRLMAQDESGVLAALKAHRRDVFDPAVVRFRGRIVKLMGDGVLVEFASAVHAVEAAVAVQTALADGGGPIRLRIGVNIGDLLVDGDDIYGDSVNVAARLEALAEPGGVLVSDDVYRQVIGKTVSGFVPMGARSLKNIGDPVKTWAWKPDGAAGDRLGTGIAPALPDRPSIAVLAFTNMSGDPEQEHFSDGISEDIITALSKLSKLFVVARNSSFTYKGRPVDVRQVGHEQGVRYVLEGSVRRGGDQVRITAQLIDTRTGHHAWAERYDRPMRDVFDLQDEITRKVTSALQVELTEGERARLWASGTRSLEAWEAVIQIPELLESHRKADILPARRRAEAALALDPGYATAWAMLGWSHWNDAFGGWSADPAATLRAAEHALDRANAIDGSNPDTLALLVFLHLSLRNFDAARSFADRAIAAGPNHAFAAGVAANVALYTDRPADMIPLLQRAMRLCPICPAWYVADLAHAYLLLDRREDAIKTASDAVAIDPDYLYSYFVIVAAHVERGDISAAHSAGAEVMRIEQDWRIASFARAQPYRDKAVSDRFVSAFRAAGLPE